MIARLTGPHLLGQIQKGLFKFFTNIPSDGKRRQLTNGHGVSSVD